MHRVLPDPWLVDLSPDPPLYRRHVYIYPSVPWPVPLTPSDALG